MSTVIPGRKRLGDGVDIPPTKTARNNGTHSGSEDDKGQEDMEVEVVYQRHTKPVFIAYDVSNPPNKLLQCVRRGLQARGVSVHDDVEVGTQVVDQTARLINEGSTCLFLLTRGAVYCPYYPLLVIQAIEKTQREGKLGGILLTHDIDDVDIPDAALLRILPRFTIQFTDDGQWRPSQIDGVLRKMTDDTPINFVLPVGNVAHAQAWSHVFGYYIPVMPFLEQRITSFESYSPRNMPVCVYELVPKTCDIPRVIGKKDPSISLIGQLKKIVVNKAGNKDRTYSLNVYCIQEGAQNYFCVAQYPNVLSAIDKMEKSKYIRMDKKDKTTQMRRFANTLRMVTNSLFKNKVRVLQFDDEKERPRDVLLNAIKADLAATQDMSETHTVSYTPNKRCDCDAYIVCSDSDTVVAGQVLDFLKMKGKNVDGCESRCGPEFQSLREAIESSRWVILLLSRESLKDNVMGYRLIEILNEGVERHDLNILPVLINLEEKHIPDALRWIKYLEKKHGYEERILQWIEGNDVPFALDCTSLPAWNLGYTLAWGYIVNYLHTVLTIFCDYLPSALENIDPNTCPQKLYLLVPDSGRCTNLVDQNCKYVEHAVRFAEIADDQGAANIVKSLDVYKITDPETKQSYHMVCQFPAPILTLCDMNDSKIAGLNDRTMKEEGSRFCTTLSLLMNGPVGNGLADKYEIVRYNDSTEEGLPKKIIPLIKGTSTF